MNRLEPFGDYLRFVIVGSATTQQGTHAHLATHRCHMLHRTVMVGRKHEAHADFVDALDAARNDEVGDDRARRPDLGDPPVGEELAARLPSVARIP